MATLAEIIAETDADKQAELVKQYEAAQKAEAIAAEKAKDEAIMSRDSERGKRKESDNKMAELSAKVEEMSTAGLSDVDKLTRQLEAANAKAGNAIAELEKAKASSAQDARDRQLADIVSGIKWSDTVNVADMKLALNAALADVSDLSDVDAWKAITEPWLNDRKSYVKADVVTGPDVQKKSADSSSSLSTVGTASSMTPADVAAVPGVTLATDRNALAATLAAGGEMS